VKEETETLTFPGENQDNISNMKETHSGQSDDKVENLYFDIYLDAAGVERLNQIIALGKTNRYEAESRLRDLIKEYPMSPQLRISLALIMHTPKGINGKIPVLEEAIVVDPGFFDGYRRLFQVLLGTAFRMNNAPAWERTELDAELLSIYAVANNYPPKERHAVIAMQVAERDSLFEPNWRSTYENAVKILNLGFARMDASRYPAHILESYQRELDTYTNLDESKLKHLIFWFYLQWTS
jgi:hypothetical protein